MEIFDLRPLSRIAGAVWAGLAQARLQALGQDLPGVHLFTGDLVARL